MRPRTPEPAFRFAPDGPLEPFGPPRGTRSPELAFHALRSASPLVARWAEEALLLLGPGALVDYRHTELAAGDLPALRLWHVDRPVGPRVMAVLEDPDRPTGSLTEWAWGDVELELADPARPRISRGDVRRLLPVRGIVEPGVAYRMDDVVHRAAPATAAGARAVLRAWVP